jgi:hypothetical protein
LVIEGRDAACRPQQYCRSYRLGIAQTRRYYREPADIRPDNRQCRNTLFQKGPLHVDRGVLEFPPNTEVEPVISLQAESEIAGYQIFVNAERPAY